MRRVADGLRGWYVVQYDAREDFGAAKSLHATGDLKALLTKTWLPMAYHLPLPGRLGTLRRRYTPALHDATIYTPACAGIRLNDFRQRRGHDWDRWIRDGRRFGEWASKRLERAGLAQGDGVFGYTGAVLEPLLLARKIGATGVVDQVSPGFVWYDILHEEADRWGCPAPEGRPDQRYVDRVKSEWDAANLMIVNSRFSKACIVAEGVSAEKIAIAEPPLVEAPRLIQPKTAPALDSPLRVLFVGTLSLAKGIQYLGEAAGLLRSKGFSFTAVGNSALPDSLLEKMKWPIDYVGHQTRETLEELYSSHDVLVFPTLCDGFGLVQVEAQARGLPVIATTACGDVVRDGLSGFVVPTRDSEAIADRLLRLREDPVLFEAMSARALIEIRRFTLERYAQSLREHLDELAESGDGL